MGEIRPASRRVALLAVLGALTMLAACGKDSPKSTAAPAAPTGRFACLDFQAKVVSGPDGGRTWTGDLVLNADRSGAFSGVLVPSDQVDRKTLEVRDRSKAVCRAIGQRNGLMISWVLYCTTGERVFGTGQFTTNEAGDEEIRGIINGPKDEDTGVYHGRNYPPYIRIISPSFS